MAIVETINRSQFHDAFNHSSRKGTFSYSGLNALYEYLDEVSEYNDNKQIELDIVGICCDFSEYENLKDFQNSYGDKYQYVIGGSADCIDYYTSVILLDEWQGKNEDTTDLPFIIQDF